MKPIPVTVRLGARVLHFGSLRDCADALRVNIRDVHNAAKHAGGGRIKGFAHVRRATP